MPARPRWCERYDSWSVSLPFARPEEVGEVQAEAETLLRLCAVRALVDGEEHPAFDSVCLVEQQERWPGERHVPAGIGHVHPGMLTSVGSVADRLDEEPQIRFRIVPSPRGRAEAVDERIRGDGAKAIGGPLGVPLVARARPEVVRPGCIAAGH